MIKFINNAASQSYWTLLWKTIRLKKAHCNTTITSCYRCTKSQTDLLKEVGGRQGMHAYVQYTIQLVYYIAICRHVQTLKRQDVGLFSYEFIMAWNLQLTCIMTECAVNPTNHTLWNIIWSLSISAVEIIEWLITSLTAIQML